jgi:tetratricopeptide (TPR) repeat protein
VRDYKLSGDIFVKTGEYEKAAEQYKKWANKRKNDAEPYVALSVPYYKENNYMKSAEYLKKAFEVDKEAAKKAVLSYEKLLEVENYSWHIFYTGAKEFLDKQELKIAKGLVEEAEEDKDSNYKAMAYVLHGRIYIMEGKETEAFDYLGKAIKLDENNGEAYLYLGEIYSNQNKPDKAISSLGKAISKNPDNLLGHKLLGQNYLKVGKYDKAIEALEKASSMSNNDQTLLYLLSSAYLQKEDYTRASDIAEKILGLPELESGAKAEAYIILGISNIHNKKYDEAIEVFDKAVEADPGKCDSYQLIAHAYNKAGKVKLSKEFSKKWERCVKK